MTLIEAIRNDFLKREKKREETRASLFVKEVGVVTTVSDTIVKAYGLPHVAYKELVRFQNNEYGVVFGIDEHEVGIVLLEESTSIHVGDEIERTGRVVDVPVGEGLIGRVIDPLGRPLDGMGDVEFSIRYPIEREAPPILSRSPVSVPLQTGIKMVDILIPVGRGQRELIVGDRKTGKSTLAIDTVLNQKDKDVLCIYCCINQRASFVAKLVDTLKKHGAMEYTTVVVSEGDNPPGIAFIAPYAATSIGEYFMESGRDVLIVYDDLIQHAQAYREISLLLRRPPGRGAYPGDIFYIHSRLLERSTHLKSELKGGSLTAFPIVETQAENIAEYISTNLISITDGQIYLSPTLFSLGRLPAIDVSKSVSRVGGKAQLPEMSAIAGDLKLTFSQFCELEEFVHYGAEVDEHTKAILVHGERIRECLKQGPFSPVPVIEQMVLFKALKEGLLDSLPIDQICAMEKMISEIVVDRSFSVDQMVERLKNRLENIA